MQVHALDGYHRTVPIPGGTTESGIPPVLRGGGESSERGGWLLVDQMVLDEPLGCSLQMMPMPLPNPLASIQACKKMIDTRDMGHATFV